MSYDITFEINTGHGFYPVEDCGNYTWNVADMYFKAMGISLSELDGKTAQKIIPILRKGIKDMQDYPAVYMALNPQNGWGNYEGALEYLEGILKAAVKHPNSRISIH